MSESLDLQTPLLLMAMPQVMDRSFHMSVVLLVYHQEDGSVGFIVNRPIAVPVTAILEGLDIQWKGDQDHAVHFGGPVQPQFGTVLYRGNQPLPGESHREIAPGVIMATHIKDLELLAESPPPSLRLYLGYAGWASGQLMGEIMRNDWLTAPVDADLVFGQADQIWRMALESVGVDPAQLPTWSPEGSDSVAN